MTAGREPFQACTEGNDKGGVGGGEEEAKKATFYWCQRQKKADGNQPGLLIWAARV